MGAKVEPIRDVEKIELIKSILKRQSMRNWYLFVLGINTGLRIGDLLQLKVEQVQKGNGEFTIKEEKTDKVKKVYMLPNLIQATEEYTKGMKPKEYLFKSGKTNEPISRVTAYRIFSSVASSVGLESIGCHTLRKTFGYHYYQKTKDVALLQEIFNHSSPSTTLIYIGINEDVKKKSLLEWGGI